MQTVPVSREITHDGQSELMAEWTAWMVISKGLSPNTIKLYRRTVECAWGEIPDFNNVTEETLERWVQSKGGKPGTVANRITALGSYFRFLVKTKRRADNPTAELDRPKIHKRIPKPINDLEAKLKVLDQFDVRANEWGSTGRRIGETRDMATFLYYTGLRIHEAVKCDWPTPCPEEAFVIGKGNKEELMQVHPKAREAWDRLGGQWGTGRDGKPIGARATQRRFEKAGFHPHQLRHTFATDLVRAGVEIGRVSKLMRHSSPAITMTYAAYQSDQNRSALDLLK